MAPKFKKADTLDEYTTEKVDVVQNNLLGDYNANGIYSINKKISQDLITFPKRKKDNYNNDIFCDTVINGDQVIDFQISFKKNTATNLAVAELYVLEGVTKQGGRMINVIKTPIGKYTDEITPDFVDKALEKFCVVTEDDDKGQEIKNEYIVKRNMLLGYINGMTEKNYNVIYEDYFTQRINLLKNTNSNYAKKVLAIFNEEYNKVSDFFLFDEKTKKVTNYKAMSELLDKAFEDMQGFPEYEKEEDEFKERMIPILGMFVSAAARIDYESKVNILNTIPKEFQENLKEPLIDIKQQSESKENPNVTETNPDIKIKEIEKKLAQAQAKAEGQKQNNGYSRADDLLSKSKIGYDIASKDQNENESLFGKAINSVVNGIEDIINWGQGSKKEQNIKQAHPAPAPPPAPQSVPRNPNNTYKKYPNSPNRVPQYDSPQGEESVENIMAKIVSEYFGNNVSQKQEPSATSGTPVDNDTENVKQAAKAAETFWQSFKQMEQERGTGGISKSK